MQHNSPYEIKERLLQAIDEDSNVIDMAAVFDVISALEKALITKEALERTRIGKYINELRKKTTNEQLARRAKELVKSWRKLLPQSGTRVNGEIISSISSPGAMTVLGPGSGFGPGPPAPGNKGFKTNVSMTGGLTRYKSCSPSLERSSSPYLSSASNSPLSNSLINQGSNMPQLAPSNYAPVKIPTRGEKTNSIKNLLNINISNQSKTSSSIFKPISPSLETNNRLSETNMLTSQRSCSPEPNSRSCSPLTNSHPRPISSVPVTYGGSSHSTLDIARTNAANKRFRKCLTFSNSFTSKEIVPNSKSRIGNGMSVVTENTLHNSAFKTLKPTNESDNPTQPIVTNLKPRKRKRSFEKNELESTLDGALASLASGSRKLPKVKTTKELIAELNAKKCLALDNLPDEKKKFLGVLSPDSLLSADHPFRSSEAEVSRTKSELLKKFLISSQSARQDVSTQECPIGGSSISPTRTDYGSNSVPESNSVIANKFQASAAGLNPIDDEINRILSALPPINLSEINLEDDLPPPVKRTSVTSDDVKRLSEPWQYVNGNYDCHGNWRPWHECTEMKSYLGETFRILPYVNIE